MKKKLLKNWKTTLSGVVALVAQLGPVVAPKVITHEVANTLSVIAGSIGVIVAKDHNVTGGTTINQPNDPKVVKMSNKTDL